MDLTLYGTQWCPKTFNLSNYLQKQWIEFDYYDVEKHESAAQEIRNQYHGRLLFPVMKIKGEWFKNPSIIDLKEALRKHKLD